MEDRLRLRVDGPTQTPAERLRAALHEAADALADLGEELLTHVGNADSTKETPGNLLTVQDLAARMKQSKDFINRHKHKWPFTLRVGRNIRFAEAGYTRWLAARQRQRSN